MQLQINANFQKILLTTVIYWSPIQGCLIITHHGSISVGIHKFRNSDKQRQINRKYIKILQSSITTILHILLFITRITLIHREHRTRSIARMVSGIIDPSPIHTWKNLLFTHGEILFTHREILFTHGEIWIREHQTQLSDIKGIMFTLDASTSSAMNQI